MLGTLVVVAVRQHVVEQNGLAAFGLDLETAAIREVDRFQATTYQWGGAGGPQRRTYHERFAGFGVKPPREGRLSSGHVIVQVK